MKKITEWAINESQDDVYKELEDAILKAMHSIEEVNMKVMKKTKNNPSADVEKIVGKMLGAHDTLKNVRLEIKQKRK